MYFHTDNSAVVWELAEALCKAGDHGKAVRFDVDDKGRLKVKIGEDMWSAPILSTDDPYRDISVYGACQSHCDIHVFNDDCVGFHNV